MTPQTRHRITHTRPHSLAKTGPLDGSAGVVIAVFVREDIKSAKAQWPRTPVDTYEIGFRFELNTVAGVDLGTKVVRFAGATFVVEGSYPPIVTTAFGKGRGCRGSSVGD